LLRAFSRDRWVPWEEQKPPAPVKSTQSSDGGKSDLSEKRKRSKAKISSVKAIYLLAYNGLLLLGWAWVLLQLLSLSFEAAYTELSSAVVFLELVAFLEVINAATGIVPGNALPSFFLHFGRDVCLLVVWAAVPVQSSRAVWLLYFMWGIGELIRYPVYLLGAAGLTVPESLTWARYTIPLGLMPVGFGCELTLFYNSSPYLNAPFDIGVLVYMLVYLFFPYYLLNSVWTQRQKKLGFSQNQKVKKTN
jgi:hypothetical protein